MDNVWNKSDFRFERKRPWKLPKLMLRNIKYSIQRVTKGYCDKDLWNIDCWFMNLMPDMLQQFKDTKHGNPDGLDVEWDNILERMIFLLREMNEETCRRKNPYQAEHENVMDEFEEKYGIFGEKLEADKKAELRRVLHFPHELQEYKDVEEKYYAEERALVQYRVACKNQALELFSKWFYDLWD